MFSCNHHATNITYSIQCYTHLIITNITKMMIMVMTTTNTTTMAPAAAAELAAIK